MVSPLLVLWLVATPPTTASPAALAALAAGRLDEVERERLAAEARGADVREGAWAWLREASRLMRCLPLDPLGPAPALGAARRLLRLEALRLERRRADGTVAGDEILVELIDRARPWQTPTRPTAPDWVVWPLTEERWPDEVIEPAVQPARCEDPLDDAQLSAAAMAARTHAERTAVAELVDEGAPHVPAVVRARVLLLGLVRGAPLSATATVAAWLDGGEPRVVAAAAVRLGRRGEVLGQREAAIAAYERALVYTASAAAEAGWARARLVTLSDDPARVLAWARGARAPRPQDAAALAHAEARALYMLGDHEALERFGRAWLERRGPPDPLGFDLRTEDLLLSLALVQPVEAAVAWTSSLGPASGREQRLEALAQRALVSGQLELASYIYDRLRFDALEARARGGAPAVARLTTALAGRARVEHARHDPLAFDAWIQELERLARDESERPLARTAPHRALATLCQAMLGPLTDARGAPQTPRFAQSLVRAIDSLTAAPTRWSRMLEAHRPGLIALAGPTAPSTPSAPRGTRGTRGARSSAAPLRSVGVVVLPRLEPPLPAPDEAPPLPTLESLWVTLEPDGALRSGPPWRR